MKREKIFVDRLIINYNYLKNKSYLKNKGLIFVDNIILIGFMGSGKSFLGKYLAKKLNIKLVDIDEQIKKSSKMSISQIFDQKGEKFFREKEYKICKKVFKLKGQVISLGGGTLSYKKNKEMFIKQNIIKKNLVLFIDAPFDVCYKRIVNTDRPILKKLSKRELYKLYLERKKEYLKLIKG